MQITEPDFCLIENRSLQNRSPPAMLYDESVERDIPTANNQSKEVSHMTEADFLSPDEMEQINNLMAKASERMKKSREKASANESHQFLFLHCQCECRRQMEQKEQIRNEFEQDIRTLLDHICSFCHKHRIPVCRKEDAGGEDDELPLPF